MKHLATVSLNSINRDQTNMAEPLHRNTARANSCGQKEENSLYASECPHKYIHYRHTRAVLDWPIQGQSARCANVRTSRFLFPLHSSLARSLCDTDSLPSPVHSSILCRKGEFYVKQARERRKKGVYDNTFIITCTTKRRFMPYTAYTMDVGWVTVTDEKHELCGFAGDVSLACGKMTEFKFSREKCLAWSKTLPS